MNKPIIFVLSILVAGAVADDIHDVMKDVVSLDGDTFYTEVAKNLTSSCFLHHGK